MPLRGDNEKIGYSLGWYIYIANTEVVGLLVLSITIDYKVNGGRIYRCD